MENEKKLVPTENFWFLKWPMGEINMRTCVLRDSTDDPLSKAHTVFKSKIAGQN